MACVVKQWRMALMMMLCSLKVLILISAEPKVPCYFIFGDSLVDNGNNNKLQTQAKVNYLPYGIDFRNGPTGRFTNGRTSADILAELLGFNNYPPPFATARGEEILKGVNYASGGAGIRPETGKNLGERIGLDQQLSNHGVTVSKIKGLLGNNETITKEYLNKCLYTVGMGSNDFINNYFSDFFPTRNQYTPDHFASLLIQQYSEQLRTLYDYGARKVAVFGLGPVGCAPEEITTFGANASGCVDMVNNAVQLFNSRIKPLVDDLKNNLHGSQYIYINVTHISGNPSNFGILSKPCCRVSTTIGKGQCLENQAPCDIRIARVFWDAFHPTETANLVIAGRSYSALSSLDAYPIDIHQLVKL